MHKVYDDTHKSVKVSGVAAVLAERGGGGFRPRARHPQPGGRVSGQPAVDKLDAAQQHITGRKRDRLGTEIADTPDPAGPLSKCSTEGPEATHARSVPANR